MSDLDPAAVIKPAERPFVTLDEARSDLAFYEKFDTLSVLQAGINRYARTVVELTEALAAEQAKTARVAELAHRFEIVPRARLLGALTAKAKPKPDRPVPEGQSANCWAQPHDGSCHYSHVLGE